MLLKLNSLLLLAAVVILVHLCYQVNQLREEHEVLHYSIHSNPSSISKQINVKDLIYVFENGTALSLNFTLDLEHEVDASDFKVYLLKLESQKTISLFLKGIGYEESQKESSKEKLSKHLFQHLNSIEEYQHYKIKNIKFQTFVYI